MVERQVAVPYPLAQLNRARQQAVRLACYIVC
jgi:hypothetical protein